MSSFASLIEKKAPKAPEQWGSFILNELKNWGRLPSDASADFQFVDRSEADRGTAIATVVIGMGDKIINVPVIVRDWKLLPMDIMEVGGEFVPFTADRISSYAVTSSPFSDVTAPGSAINDYGQNIARLVIPPLRAGGMVKTWSDKSASHAEMLTPKLVRSFTKPELNSRLMPLDNRAYANYKKHGTFDVLLGVINGPDGGSIGVAQAFGDDLENRDPSATRVLWVRRPSQEDADRGFGTVLAASGRSFDPALIRLPVKDMVRMYSNESGIDPLRQTQVFIQQGYADGVPIADVDHSGAAGHDIGVSELNVDNLDPERSLAIISGAGGKGAGFHNVAPGGVIQCLYSTPDTSKHTKAMIADFSTLVVGDKFYGVYTPGKPDSNAPCALAAGDASVGGLGNSDSLYVFLRKGTHAVAYGPMSLSARITTPLTVAGQSAIISQFDGTFGLQPVMVQRSSLFQDISLSRGEGGLKLMLPDDFKLVRVDQNVLRSPESPADVGFIAKLAHEQAGDWLKAWSIDRGASISLDMPSTVKKAYQRVLDEGKTGLSLDRLEPKTAEFIVIAAGVKPEDAREFIKEATEEPMTAYGISYLPAPVEPTLTAEQRFKIASLRRGLARQLAKAAIDQEVFKLAAGMEGRQTVDAILGLGLANEQNVDTLVGALPKYEEVLKALASMLKDARLHGSPVEESKVQKAMVAVEDFIEQAKSYIASVNQIQSTGASGIQMQQQAG